MVIDTSTPTGWLFIFLMASGGLFWVLEVFVRATPPKEDDEKWEAFKSGYVGPFIIFVIDFFKKNTKK